MTEIKEITLMEKNLKKHLMRIQNTPGITFKKITASKYYIAYKGLEWFIWPKSSKYIQIKNDEPVADMYWGDMKSFYHRYIAESYDLPKNHGKLWTESDLSVLLEMLENEASVNEIAAILERHPQTIIDRLHIIFEGKIEFLKILEDQWDFIISDIIGIYQ